MNEEKRTEIEIRKRLALEIAIARRVSGLRAVELAEKAEIEQSRLSRIENGWLWPYPEEMKRILKALKSRSKDASIDDSLISEAERYFPQREKKTEGQAA